MADKEIRLNDRVTFNGYKGPRTGRVDEIVGSFAWVNIQGSLNAVFLEDLTKEKDQWSRI